MSFKNKFHHISVTGIASDFKCGMQLGFANAHHQIQPEENWLLPWARGAPQDLGVPL